MTSAAENLTISLSARLWARIDATIDNSVSVAQVEGQEHIYEPGRRVRQAGWAVLRSAPDTNEIGWPPEDYQMSIVLIRSDWVYVLQQLERWAQYGDDDENWFIAPARQLIESALGVSD